MADLGDINTVQLEFISSYKIVDSYESAYKNLIPDVNVVGYQITTLYEGDLTHKAIENYINHDGMDVKYIELGDSGGPNTSIIVTVKIENNITSGIRVVLFERETNLLVGMGYSDIQGNVVFDGLSKYSKYYAVAFTEQDYNALIYDKLIPS